MNVAIVGTGISGITLALRLQQLGVATTCARRAIAGRSAGGADREPRRSVPGDPGPRAASSAWPTGTTSRARRRVGIDVDVVGTPLGFRGALRAPGARGRLPRLPEPAHRGLRRARRPARGRTASGHAVGASCPDRGHDVVVVAAGRGAPLAATLFPVRPDRSPYAAPQRRLLGGLYRGVEPTDPPTVSFNIVPGAGEIFQQPFLTDRGVVAADPGRGRPGRALGAPSPASTPAVDPRPLSRQPCCGRSRSSRPRLAARIDPRRFAPLGSARCAPAVPSPRRCAAGGRRCPTVGSHLPSVTPGSSTTPSPARGPTSGRTAPGTRPPRSRTPTASTRRSHDGSKTSCGRSPAR